MNVSESFPLEMDTHYTRMHHPPITVQVAEFPHPNECHFINSGDVAEADVTAGGRAAEC